MVLPSIEWPDTLRVHGARLERVIAGHGPMAVAFSGGVDSGLLAWTAHAVLGEKMMCVVGISPSFARREERAALAFLEKHGIAWERLETSELQDPRYQRNDGQRCFFCKDELFARMAQTTQVRFPVVAYGANLDDGGDHRPGVRAADSRGVVAPLAEAGLTKALVRALARAASLELWDKPAAPCLASRIPYFDEVTEEKLQQIEAAEDVLHALGFTDCRVRHHGAVARIELPQEDHARLAVVWQRVETGLRAAGFADVEMESDGLRSGRLNDALGGA